MPQIILGSTSPRRKEILQFTGLKFRVVAPRYEEDMTLSMAPKRLVAHLSQGKALEVSQRYPKAIVIGADTIVVLGKEVLGKPHNKKRSQQMLKKLSGTTHTILTSLTIARQKPKKIITVVAATKVKFNKMTPTEIKKLSALPETWDKAGAYAAQGLGGIFINKIEGEVSTVVGLPLGALYKGLKQFGINIF